MARPKRKVEVFTGDECVEWDRYLDKWGYGSTGGKLVHRLAYEERFGKIPDGYYVCHTCDNPRCYNTDHLFLGTNRDNQLDSLRKGRSVGYRLATRSHCQNGHRFTPENTRRRGGVRYCRACESDRARRYRERKERAGQGAEE